MNLIEPGVGIPAAALRGIVPALITPLDEAGRVDESSIQSLVEFRIGAGVHGLVVLCSAGEGPLLPVDEKVASRSRLPPIR
jgi:dihydrodipicolinate synthase/N-acetylneuraminate lyase